MSFAVSSSDLHGFLWFCRMQFEGAPWLLCLAHRRNSRFPNKQKPFNKRNVLRDVTVRINKIHRLAYRRRIWSSMRFIYGTQLDRWRSTNVRIIYRSDSSEECPVCHCSPRVRSSTSSDMATNIYQQYYSTITNNVTGNIYL